MKYIDADKLIAEIEKLLVKAENDEKKAFAKIDAAGHLAAVTKTTVCVKIKKLISTLQQEQPDVDIRKELGRLKLMGSNDARDIQTIARHFYELGLKTRKEE